MIHMLQTSTLFDLSHTVARELLLCTAFPWEIFPKISSFIERFGHTLPKDKFYHPFETVWIAKSAKVDPSVCILGPCIVDENAELRQGACLRGSAIIGKEAVVGHATEVKNAILFDEVKIPHFNYVGDSVMGYRSHFGAGTVTSNLKLDKTNVCISGPFGKIETGLRKFGALVGDGVEVGCHSVLNPGTVIGRFAAIYPLSSVRGYVGEDTIYKTGGVSEMRSPDRIG